MGDPNQLPREFRITGGFGRVVRSYLSVMVGAAVIFGVVSVDAVGWWGAIAIAMAVVGLIVGRLFSNFRGMRTGTVVTFSERGVEWRDKVGFRLRLRWPDITRIEAVETRLSAPYIRRRRWNLAVNNDGVLKSPGLIGWGERITPLELPSWMWDRLAAAPRNPKDGRPEVAIALGLIDLDWQRTGMGDLVRHHRPDLFDDDSP